MQLIDFTLGTEGSLYEFASLPAWMKVDLLQ
jgi:hypothetical protein